LPPPRSARKLRSWSYRERGTDEAATPASRSRTDVMAREQIFDDDYLYFYEPVQSEEANDREGELVWDSSSSRPEP